MHGKVKRKPLFAEYMNIEQAARYLGIGRSTLYAVLSEGIGPKSILFPMPKGKTMRRFRKSDLDAWAEQNVIDCV